MSRLRPRLQLQLLAELPLGVANPKPDSKGHFRHSTLFRAAGLLAAFGGLMIQTPSAWALDFFFGDTSPEVPWPSGSQAETFQQGGVTLDFEITQSPGVVFSNGTPQDSDTSPINLTGGLTNGNLLITHNPDDIPDTVNINLDFLNAAGNRVPVENLTHTLIDLDRDDGREWQDVSSAVSLLGGTPVPTSAIAGSGLGPGGTAENVTGNAAAIGYTEPAGAVTFRGVTDRDDSTLNPVSPDPAGVEAANNNGTPPGSTDGTEGSVVLTYGTTAVDQIQITYGNGPAAAADNGTGVDLYDLSGGVDPGDHGMGFFGDFSFDPGIIGVAKEVTSVVDNNDGTFNITYSVVVENLGETTLSNVQLDDDLIAPGNGITSNTFSAAGGSDPFTIVTPPTPTGALTTNAGYDGGNSNSQLLGAGNSLAVGASETLTYTVQVTPGAGSTLRYDTQVSATGNTPSGGTTTDISNDGAAVEDGAGDNDPTSDRSGGVDFPVNATTTAGNGSTVAISGANAGDETVTVAVLPAQPRIGVTKQVSNVTNNNDGTYTVTYRQIVRNLGTEDLSNVVLTDQDFATTFRTGTATGVTSATIVGGSVSVSGAAPAGFPAGYNVLTGTPTFDGVGNLQLATIASLPVGGYGVVDYQVLVDPTDPIDGTIENLGDGTLGGASPDDDNPYESQVTAAGTGATSTTAVTDLSDDVTGFPNAADQLPRDLNGNGTATDPVDGGGAPQSSPIPADPTNDETTDENNRTPVTFTGSPAIALSKRVTNVTANPDGTFDVTYRQLVQNIGGVALDSVQIAEDDSITDIFRVGQPDGATSAVVQSVTAVAPGVVSPGDTNGVTLTAGAPAGLSGAGRTLLAGSDTLLPNQFGAVDYVVRVTPGNTTEGYGGNNLPFSSQATATGIATTLGGTSVTDPSDDGVEFPNGAPSATDPAQTLDPDGDSNANEGVATLEPIDPDGNTTTTATQASENNPTPVRFPKLAVAKEISDVTGSGTAADPYIVTYDVTVQNVGGIRLTDVQVTEENIDDVFDDLPAGDTTVLGPVTQVSGIPTTVNPGFDGEATTQLIDPGTLLTLEPDEASVLRYQVQVINPTDNTPYDSSSTGSGTGIPSDGNGPIAGNPLTVVGDADADGTTEAAVSTGLLPVSDLSDDGTDPDPVTTDGNRGSGAGENDPTVATFPVGPQIGLTKQVVSTTPVDGQPGVFDVTFEYVVENVGVVPLNGLDITDNYDTQFDIGQPTAVSNYEVLSVTPGAPATPGDPTLVGGTTVVGSGPNSGNLSVATGNTTQFDPGESATVQVVVRVTPEGDQLGTVYDGTATASGTSVNDPTQSDTDLSDDIPPADATDPRVITADSGILGDGVASGESADDATPVVFELADSGAGLQLFKAITSTSVTGDITTQLPGAPDGILGTNQLPDELQPGDTVQYTIYYVNNAATVFSGLEICDPLPSPLQLNQFLTVGGSFIDALVTVPTGNTSCPVNDAGLAVQVDGDGNPTSDPNGAVIFAVGDVAPGTTGSVVFEATVP